MLIKRVSTVCAAILFSLLLTSFLFPWDKRVVFKDDEYYPQFRYVTFWTDICPYGCHSFKTKEEAIQYLEQREKEDQIVWED